MLIEEQLQLPRLTGTVRAFSHVSKKYEELSSNAEKNLIKKRKASEQYAFSKSNDLNALPINWQNLMIKLIPEMSDSKSSKLRALLEKLKTNISKQFLNEDFNDTLLLNEASLFIFESFYDHRNLSSASSSNFENLDKLSKKLKEKFGQFQRNLFDQCKDVMESIFNEISSLNRSIILDDLFKSRKVIELGNQTDDSMKNLKVLNKLNK